MDSKHACPQGWDMTQLLSYAEGDLEDAARVQVELHVKVCPYCAEELASLQRMRALLVEHPEAFHPDEEELYRFVSRNEDASSKIAAHLESCDACRQDAELLRAMISGSESQEDAVPAMPQGLVHKLGQTDVHAEIGTFSRFVSSMKEFLGWPFRMPVLALGSAAAVLIVVTVCLPLWRSLQVEPSQEIQALPRQMQIGKMESRIQPKEAARRMDELQARQPEKPAVRGVPEANYVRPPAPPEEARESAPAAPIPQQKRELKKSKAEGVAPSKDAAPAIKPSPAVPASRFEPTPEGRPQPAFRAIPGPMPQEMKTDGARPEVPAGERKKAALGRAAPHALRPSHRRSAGKEVATATNEPAKGSASPVPLTIRITDAQGNPLPWIDAHLPSDLAQRFRVVIPEATEHDARDSKTLSSEQGLVDKQTETAPGLRVEIRIFPSNGAYDVECKLFDPRSDREMASVVAIRKSREEVPQAVNDALRRLLKDR